MYSKLIDKVVLAHSSNYTHNRGGYKICKITPHHMAGILTGEQCAKLFQKPNRDASANYCIGNDGDIVCNVEEEYRAWTSSDYENDCQAITIEVSNSTMGPKWEISQKAWDSLVNLCVDVCKRYGFRLVFDGSPKGSLTMHKMFAATACPGPYLSERMHQLADEVNAKLSDTKPNPKPNKELYRVRKTWADAASQLGAFENLDNAKKLADKNKGYEVYDSKGKQVYPKSVSKPSKTIDQLADEVLAGKWGNGSERKKKLEAAGYNYDKVQDRVNEKLYGKNNKKSIDQVAREVIRGDWGNGETRKKKLTAAGYDYYAVQRRVEELL